MSNDTDEPGDYQNWKADIRQRIEANEGHETPDAQELWNRARFAAKGAASWIDDMPVSENEIETAKGDILKALVALEMAQERLNGGDGGD